MKESWRTWLLFSFFITLESFSWILLRSNFGNFLQSEMSLVEITELQKKLINKHIAFTRIIHAHNIMRFNVNGWWTANYTSYLGSGWSIFQFMIKSVSINLLSGAFSKLSIPMQIPCSRSSAAWDVKSKSVHWFIKEHMISSTHLAVRWTQQPKIKKPFAFDITSSIHYRCLQDNSSLFRDL